MRPMKKMLRGDRTVAMTKDVVGGRSNPTQERNPERGYAFMENTNFRNIKCSLTMVWIWYMLYVGV